MTQSSLPGTPAVTSASLAGVPATDVRVQIPAWGCIWADITLSAATTLTGRVTLALADLTIQGAVIAGGPAAAAGRSYYRIVSGAGGWPTQIAEKSYASDAGVKLATVLGDAATAAGETLDQTTVPATRIGPYYTRPEDAACRVLEQVSPSAWYVDVDGVTRIGSRATSTLTTKYATTSELDPARGTVTIASPTIAGILPGLQIAGLTAVDVEHEWSESTGLRSRIWGAQGTGTSRRLSALRMIFQQMDPGAKFRGVWEYRIVSQNGNRLNLQPVKVSTGMPSLQNVRVRPGMAGLSGTYSLGSYVLVAFVNADPSRPVVVGFTDPDEPGFIPTVLALAGGGAAVARSGDSTKVKAYFNPGSGGAVLSPIPVSGATEVDLSGTVTSGSSIVSSG